MDMSIIAEMVKELENDIKDLPFDMQEQARKEIKEIIEMSEGIA